MINASTISRSFETLIESLRRPAQTISGIIMLCAMVKRPGLSCIVSTSNILQDIANKGIPTGPLPDGSKNLMNEMIASQVCEMIRAIKEDANIQMALPPGALTVNVNGSNSGGPFTAIGFNTTSGVGVGLIQ